MNINNETFWLNPNLQAVDGLAEESSKPYGYNTKSLRPIAFEDYIGQSDLKKLLQISVSAAKSRGDSLDHVLLHGPPGLGKTSMAMVLATEMCVEIKVVSAPIISKPGELAAILNSISKNSVLFIDEIHRLPRAVEEILYSAMEDFRLDILVGAGNTAESVRIDLPRFTLVGATTRSGLLTHPLRDRFGLVCRLNFYSIEELVKLVTRSAKLLEVKFDSESILEIAKRSRGTPRIANRLIRRVRDYVQHLGLNSVDGVKARESLDLIGVDPEGLDVMDKRILQTINDKFGGGPVGIDTLAVSLNEDAMTIQEMYEPFLIEKGYLNRTRQGRIITELGSAFLTSIARS